MRATKLLLTATAAWSATAASLLGTLAAEWGLPAETNAGAVRAEVRHEGGPGQLSVDRVYVTVGTNKFALLVPDGFKMEPSNDGGVALVNRDYSCQIIFRVAGPLPPEGGELDSDAYSGRVLAQHPGTSILNTFSAVADSRRGPAYEVQFSGPAKSTRRALIAYIPSQNAVLEFSLVSDPDKFEAARHQFNTMLVTFRASDARGELHISPLSDKL